MQICVKLCYVIQSLGAINAQTLRCAGSASAICSAIPANAFSYTMKHIRSLVHSSPIGKLMQSTRMQSLVQWVLRSKAVSVSNPLSDRSGQSNAINLSTVNSAIDANSIRSALNTHAIATTTGRCGFIANKLHSSKTERDII